MWCNIRKTFNRFLYHIDVVRKISDAITIPLIACGGAGSVIDLGEACRKGRASAVAAGSMFVFMGPNRAVLIQYPDTIDFGFMDNK